MLCPGSAAFFGCVLQVYKGVEGQNKTNWCYSQRSKPAGAEYANARDLVTDGYNNYFYGTLPDTPCGGGSHVQRSPSQQGSGAGSRGATGSGPTQLAGYGRHFSKILLTVNFRVAAGRQFDRTYWFQIGRAVVSALALGVLVCVWRA